MVYLQKHLEMYPKMESQDIIKLLLQGILGPAHLVTDYDKCLKRVTEEYQSIKEDNHEIVELISDKYVRIYLYPYYQKYHSFEKLVECFIKSSEIKEDNSIFVAEVKKLINELNKFDIEQYLESGNYLISHSDIYKENYDPHYLVIHRQYLDELITD